MEEGNLRIFRQILSVERLLKFRCNFIAAEGGGGPRVRKGRGAVKSNHLYITADGPSRCPSRSSENENFIKMYTGKRAGEYVDL